MEQKTERNKLIVDQLKKGKTLVEVAEMFGLKAKSTVSHIYKMARIKGKYGFVSYPQEKNKRLARVRN